MISTKSPAAAQDEAGRVRFANQLRGLAAFGVVWHHLGVQYWTGKGFAAALVGFSVPAGEMVVPMWAAASKAIQALGGSKIRFDLGELSVALFFLISGFVIPMSLRKLTVSQFAVSRVLRIYPPYLASIGLLLVVSCVIGPMLGGPGRFEVPVSHWLAQAFLVVDVFSTPLLDLASWTLLVELKFYIVCACFAVQIRQGRVLPFLYFFVGVALVTTALRFPAVVAQAGNILGHGTMWPLKQITTQLAYASFMFCGYCFFLYWSGKLSLAKLALLGVTFWLFALLIFWLGKLPLAEIRRMALSQSLAIAMFGTSMFMATSFKPNRVLDALATISYPLYITHLVVGWATLSWCLSNSVPPFIALLVAIALALFAAWCLHRLVEKPSVALTKKWRSAKAASS